MARKELHDEMDIEDDETWGISIQRGTMKMSRWQLGSGV